MIGNHRTGADVIDDDGATRERAIHLLTAREHGRQELIHKLEQRGFAQASVVRVVARLEQQGLQCDSRFAESYARSRHTRGYGRLQITAELAFRGVDRELADSVCDDEQFDWCESATRALYKKYRKAAATASSQRQMQQYLYRRGFDTEIANEAITRYQHDES